MSSNINYNNFENICRTCMFNCDVKFPQDNIITDVYYKLTDINFETNDDLPQQICQKCFQKINEIHAFALQCKLTHFSLMKCLKNKQSKKNETSEPVKVKKEITNEENTIEFVEVAEKTLTQEVEMKQEPNTSNKNEDNKVTCDTCNKTFNTLSLMKRHMVQHSGERPYKCDECSMTFTHSHKLITHMRKHNGERPYKCEQCAKTFARAIYLTTHMRTHSGERPYKCDQCAKSFTQLITLKVHMRTHSGERLYKCEQCSMSFTQSHNLKVHMRTHSGERPFKCDQCPMSFIQSIHLQRHVYTHSGERPFKCDQCDKSFTQSHNLVSHMRSHAIN